LFTYVVLLLIEAPKIRRSLTKLVSPERAKRFATSAIISDQSPASLGDMLTSLAAGTWFHTLVDHGRALRVFLWVLWVALVDFLAPDGGALPVSHRSLRPSRTR